MTEREAGSFRDPSGYVFRANGRIYRAIDSECQRLLRDFSESGLLKRLSDSHALVQTQFVDGPESKALATEHAPYRHFLEHEEIAQLTYPHEWTVSMLADAGLLTLDLQKKLLEAGFSLKDGTAYNVQFRAGRPVFIDVASIERPARLDVWVGLGQFAQMFLFPLLLSRYRGWDLRSYFLGSIQGRTLEQVATSFGRLERWRPRLLLDVTLPYLLHRRGERGDRGDSAPAARAKGKGDALPQIVILSRLRRKIRALAASYRPRGVWTAYTSNCTYDEPAERRKKELVREFLESARPSSVLDLGCNTGDYSYLAAALGAQVVAADADHDAVEMLYRRLRKEPAPITPMTVDLCNPSPAIGYMNRERTSFLERTQSDCVLALALLHHLHVAGNLPLESIRDLLARLTRAYLILEFVPREDPMFRKLMRFRVDLYQNLTLDVCRKVFSETFELQREESIAGSMRTLLVFRRRT